MSKPPVGAAIGRQPEAEAGGMQNAKCKMQNEGTGDASILNSQFSTFTSPLPAAWDALLDRPFDREPFRRTLLAVEAAAALETVYPPRADWFAAFRLTPPERVRVVILGQDPYHEPDQAMGLAFSVRQGVKLPPSLRNIYQELEADLGVPAPSSGDLSPWAEQGVLLLNTVLTVAAGRANSHKNLGWQRLTAAVIAAVARLPQPVAFVLWGGPAQRAYDAAVGAHSVRPPDAAAGMQNEGTGIRSGAQCAPRNAAVDGMQNAKCKMQNEGTKRGVGTSIACPQGMTDRRGSADEQCSSLQAGPRLILSAPHPSPLSAYRGFFGSKPFSQINAFLAANGENPIDWSLK